jgi:outer membrane protein assembly factor BamD (BamD/ComL family)
VFGELIKKSDSEQLVEIAYYQRGDCRYFKKGEDREPIIKAAIKEYDEYLKKFPDGKYAARAMYMQGNGYVTLEMWPEAKQKLETVVTKYPQFEEYCSAKNFYAFSLNRMDQWKKAEELFNQVIRGECTGQPLEFAKEQREAIRTSRM